MDDYYHSLPLWWDDSFDLIDVRIIFCRMTGGKKRNVTGYFKSVKFDD